MRTVRVRCDVKGTARRARQRWHCAGCKRTADVCMLVKLDDMADKRKVFVDTERLFNGRLWQTKMGKVWLANKTYVLIWCRDADGSCIVCGLVADVAHVRAG